MVLAGDTQNPDVKVKRLLLSGALSVVGGASLHVERDIAAPSGTLRVSGMDPGGRGSFVAIGTDSSLGTLELSGRIESAGGIPSAGQWDDMPKLQVGAASFSTPGGSFLPSTLACLGLAWSELHGVSRRRARRRADGAKMPRAGLGRQSSRAPRALRE